MISLHRTALGIPARSLQQHGIRTIYTTRNDSATTSRDDIVGTPPTEAIATNTSTGEGDRSVAAEGMKSLTTVFRAVIEAPVRLFFGAVKPAESFQPAAKQTSGQADDAIAKAQFKSILQLSEKSAISVYQPHKCATLVRDVDVLNEAIARAITGDELFEVLENHGAVMTKDHLLQCLETLKKLSRVPSGAFESNLAFRTFCDILLGRMDLFAPRELVGVLESAHPYKLTASSPIVRGILESLRLKLKDFTLHELIYLHDVLQRIDGWDAHLEVMNSVIPIVFESRYRKELDMTDIKHCHAFLIFVLRSRVDLETFREIAKIAAKVSPYFSSRQALNLFLIVGNNQIGRQKIQSIRDVCEDCLGILSRSLATMNKQTIWRILAVLHRSRIGNETFLKALWKLAPTWSLSQVGLLLKASFSTGYMTQGVAELVTELVLKKKHEINRETSMHARFFAEAIALASQSHLPMSGGMARCVQAANALIGAEDFIENVASEGDPETVDLLLALSFMGVFPVPHLQNVFDPNSQRRQRRIRSLLELESQLRLHYGGDSPYRVLPELKRTLAEQNLMKQHYPRFETALVAAVGGRQFFCGNVKTPLGTIVDYVVTPNQPIPSPALGNILEEIPPSSKPVAILICQSRYHTFGLTGLRKLRVPMKKRHLEAQNLRTIVFDWDEFSPPDLRETITRISEALGEALLSGPVNEPDSVVSEVHCTA